MPPFLNPTKICLLVLIELYVQGGVEDDAVLPVLDLIATYILDSESINPSAPDQRWNTTRMHLVLDTNIRGFAVVLRTFAAQSGRPGRTLWDSFVSRLWLISSLDHLYVFFANLYHVMARTKAERRWLTRHGFRFAEHKGIRLTRRSPLGAFVRRCNMEFVRLRFVSTCDVWKGFARYRHPSLAYIQRRMPGMGPLSFDSVVAAGRHVWRRSTMNIAAIAYEDLIKDRDGGPLPAAPLDIESLTEFQVGQLQKYGARVPMEIRRRFDDMVRRCQVTPCLTFYLDFLDAWKSGDYPGAFEHLHRYFDYTMYRQGRVFYQYALMNLAVLQADFGCLKDGVETMLETVRVAREHQDTVCLNFAVSWLFHLERVHPRLVNDLGAGTEPNTPEGALAFLQRRARQSKMFTMWGAALLGEARLMLSIGGSVAEAVGLMVRSSVVVIKSNSTDMFSAQLGAVSGLWDRLGLGALALTTCEVYVRCHADNALFDDEVKMTCRLATLLAQRGRYDDGLKQLTRLHPDGLRAYKPNQYWRQYRGVLQATRHLHNGDMDGADEILRQLLQLQRTGGEVDVDLTFRVDALHFDLLLRRGDLEAASDKIELLLDPPGNGDGESDDIAVHVRMLIMKARLFARRGRPQGALTAALRAATTAYRALLVNLLWQALGAVAHILNALGEFEAARDLLETVLPRCLEVEEAYAAGELYSHLADAYMGMAGESSMDDEGSTGRADLIMQGMTGLDRAFRHYEAAEDVGKQCEVRAKEATIVRALGDPRDAAIYAGEYLALRKRGTGATALGVDSDSDAETETETDAEMMDAGSMNAWSTKDDSIL